MIWHNIILLAPLCVQLTLVVAVDVVVMVWYCALCCNRDGVGIFMSVFVHATCLLWVFCDFVTNTMWWWPCIYIIVEVIVCGVVWNGVHVFVFMLSYFCTLSIWGCIPFRHWPSTKCACVTEVTIASRTVSCFFINYKAVNCGTPRSLSNNTVS